MAKLRVTIPGEVELEFTCENLKRVRDRALAFVRDANVLKATSKASNATALLACSTLDGDEEHFEPRRFDVEEDAFFFDNTDYTVYAKLLGKENEVSDLRVRSRFATDETDKKYARFEGGRVRSGTLNFENDIGWFDFTVCYKDADGRGREFTFTSEALSQKLDSRKDWKKLVADVETRYAMLAADFLRKTYHSFDRRRSSGGDTPDLIWWNLFEAERQTFLKAIRTIVERPRMRLVPQMEYRRADQLRVMSPSLENEFMENRFQANRLYEVPYKSSSHDTPENRFVKYALGSVFAKYKKLREQICSSAEFGKRLSESARQDMLGVENNLRKQLAHPFFKTVGPFTGLRQLSLTLQNAPGYATVARTFAILNSSYLLFEGIKRLETKSVADLYEIWCFLKVEEIVRECCKANYGAGYKDPKANHGELCGAFVKQLGTGSTSEVVFTVDVDDGGGTKHEVELARVIYNPKITDKERRDNALRETVVPTSLTAKKGQIPDIVLKLSRRSVNDEKALELTYLFDAKYRIEDAAEDEAGVTMRPPQDAIDQMHRYRDAIYYAEKGTNKSLRPADFKREVIGGYILFPGVCTAKLADRPNDDEDDSRPPYFGSIDKVNIGAIPLRPNDEAEVNHLRDFIEELIFTNPTVEAAIDRLNPQHGSVLEKISQESIVSSLLVGFYRSEQREWMRERRLHGQKIYYNFPCDKAREVGIPSLAAAQEKKLLTLLQRQGMPNTSIPYKIVRCTEIDRQHLIELHGYPHKTPDDQPADKMYYLYEILPLIDPLANLASRLKIVTLRKDGVCHGVAKVCERHGLELVEAGSVTEALNAADGAVILDDKGSFDGTTQGIIVAIQKRHISHQPLPINVSCKRSRDTLVRWIRILLGLVSSRKYVLYIDGRTNEDGEYLENLVEPFVDDVFNRI